LENVRSTSQQNEEKYVEQIKLLEKEKARRPRIFRPAKKKGIYIKEALQEKIDLKSHIGTLKKTDSPYLSGIYLFFILFLIIL
jgi:hypothetical protein